jgi:hypothetical protein
MMNTLLSPIARNLQGTLTKMLTRTQSLITPPIGRRLAFTCADFGDLW